MTLFKQKADRLPVIIFFSYFLVDLFVYITIDSIPFLIIWFLLGIWPKGNICAWNHHHQHCFTFNNGFANRLLEIMYGLQTGVIGYTWVLHHNLGHHMNYLDQTKDESRWMDLKTNKKMSRLKYAFEVTATSYYRCFQVGKKHPKELKQFNKIIIITLFVLAALTIYRPVQALIIFWIPMLVSLTLTADATYCHHMKFGLHWSKLPKLHQKIKKDIPDECYLEPMILFKVLDNISAYFNRRAIKH